MDLALVGITKLADAVEIDGQSTAAKQALYIVPVGKTLFPIMVAVHSLSGSLAGLTDVDIGGNAAADDWLQQVSLAGMTSTSDWGVIRIPWQDAGPPVVPEKLPLYTGGTVFGVQVNTGATSSETFKVDLWGYLMGS